MLREKLAGVTFHEFAVAKHDLRDYVAVEEYQRHLLENVGNSPSTVNAKVAKIRRMRELAVRAGVDALPPMPGNIPLNHINKALWTADELQAVVGDLSLRGLVKHAHILPCSRAATLKLCRARALPRSRSAVLVRCHTHGRPPR